MALISMGGWFELYDLFFTGYIAPGLAKSGILASTTESFFGFSGIGAFIAATFAGLFIVFLSELRARTGGLAYSSSRAAAICSGFLIAFFLREFGVTGAFGLITACMIGVMVVIGVFGPSSRDLEFDGGH